jgi:hypothetical protein
MGKVLGIAALAVALTLAGPASAQLAVGTGWDVQDAYLYGNGGGLQFVASEPAYLEFTTLIGDRSVVDIYLLNLDCTSPIGAVCWQDIGTTSQGLPLASLNPPADILRRRTSIWRGRPRTPLMANC